LSDLSFQSKEKPALGRLLLGGCGLLLAQRLNAASAYGF